MDSTTLLYIIIGIVSADFILEQVLDLLNIRAMQKEVPDEVKDFYDKEKYAQSILYQKENARFGFLSSGFSFLLTLALLIFGGFGWIDALLRPMIENPILLSLAFFGVIMFASDILSLPFQLYSTFVIEQKYGFNTTTYKLFFTDKLKGYLLGAIIGGVLGGLLLWLITSMGPNFWLYFWIIASAFILFMNIFYSTLILPLFNKLMPLEEGELKDAIMQYSKKVAFPLDHIYVIDGSKRSKKANAFFMGLGKKKKVVLYDTLIENHSIEELVGVLAHEVGHYKKKHIISGFIFSVLQMGITLFVMSFIIYNEGLSHALGGMEIGIHLNLIAFGILYSPVSKISGIAMNIISRKNEFEADRYAGETYRPEPLMEGLKKLSVDNLSNLYPHPAYVFFHYSHPPLLKRLEALKRR
ncbi:MAG: M48 family metallopeptidase [Cyclobacteriaceae bacterium]|nr:M48 family metallopeptidase [Cyclobacteriaceae bacterium]